MNKQTRTDYRPARLPSARLINMGLVLLILASASLSTLWGNQPLYAQSTLPATTPPSAGRIAVVGSTSALLVVTPNGDIVQTFAPGVSLTATGRTADSQWVAVKTSTAEVGWVQAQQLILFGLAELPITTPTVAEPTLPNPPALPVPQTVPLTTTTAPLSPTVSSSPTVTVPPTTQLLATITLTEGRLNVRTGPATTYPIISKATSGQIYRAQARTTDGSWIQVLLPTGELGWVARQYVALDGEVALLPIFEPPPLLLPVADAPIVTRAQPESTVPTNSPVPGLPGKLVFSTSSGGLFYLYHLATGKLYPLTTGQDPALSPDGTQVVFTRGNGENGLYLINSDGSGERKIFGEQDQLRSPKWSPDGQWIVFSRAAGQWTCYIVGPDCSTRQALLSQLPPTVANDPKATAKFLSQFDAVTNADWSIARVKSNGDDYRDLPALNTALMPDWSVSGIVYQSTAGLQKTADTATPDNRAVVVAPNLQDPAWQPGGGQIVYQAKRGNHWEIFSINPDGSNNRALTQPVTTLVDQLPSNGSPAWSPDGQYIAFLSNRTDTHEAGPWRIWVMNADGSNQQPLPLDVPLAYGFNGEQMISWGQ